MELEQAIGAIASRLQIDANEFISSLKEGENWKEDAADILGNTLSDHIKSAKEAQHGRGLREYQKMFLKTAAKKGYKNPEGKEGIELFEDYNAWIDDQTNNDDPGKKPAELTKEELMKLPVFKTAKAEILQAAQQEIETVKAEFEAYKGKENRKTLEEAATAEMLEYLTAKGAQFESDALGVKQDDRLKRFKKLIFLEKLGLNEQGKVVILDEDGEPLLNNLGKPVTYESIVVGEWAATHGFPKQDPKKGGPTPGLKDKTKEGEGAMRFDSADDFNKYISSEPDATKRFEAQKAYLAQTEGEGGE